jgi:hypothetical protein
MTNKYAASCSVCFTYVPVRTGVLQRINGKWNVTCVDCACPESRALLASTGDRTSFAVSFSSGEVFYRNRRGRCEDAPCCGCCTI